MSATDVAAGDTTAIREFEIGFDESELTELRRRIGATRWPERETVGGRGSRRPPPALRQAGPRR
jgi:hypothetical protein